MSVKINEHDYIARLDLLKKSYPVLKDKLGKQAINVDQSNHVVVLSKYSDSRMTEYFVKVCLNELLAENFSCMIIANYVLNNMSSRINSQDIENFKNCCLFLRQNREILLEKKEDIVLPDFLYFFDMATRHGEIIPDEKALLFANQLIKSVCESFSRNNL